MWLPLDKIITWTWFIDIARQCARCFFTLVLSHDQLALMYKIQPFLWCSYPILEIALRVSGSWTIPCPCDSSLVVNSLQHMWHVLACAPPLSVCITKIVVWHVREGSMPGCPAKMLLCQAYIHVCVREYPPSSMCGINFSWNLQKLYICPTN